MNPELDTILSNVLSLIGEAQQIVGAETQSPNPEDETAEQVTPELAEKIMTYLNEIEEEEQMEEPLIEEEEIIEDEELEEEEVIEMEEDEEDVEKAEDGTTASDDAEDIIEETGEVNEENINEVAKAIVHLLRGGKSPKGKKVVKAKKTVKKSDNVNQLRAENKQLRDAVGHILEGLGVADEIKSQVDNTVQKSEVKNDPNEIKKTLDYIKAQLGVDKVKTTPEAGNKSLRKSLTDDGGAALKGIFNNQSKK